MSTQCIYNPKLFIVSQVGIKFKMVVKYTHFIAAQHNTINTQTA